MPAANSHGVRVPWCLPSIFGHNLIDYAALRWSSWKPPSAGAMTIGEVSRPHCHWRQRSARPWPASQNRCGSQGNDIAHNERSSLNAAESWRHFSRLCRVAIPAPAGFFLLPFCCRDFAATNGIRRNCGGRRGLPVAMISDSYEPTCRPHSVFSDPRNGAVPGASTVIS
jgi:hypothetical protein